MFQSPTTFLSAAKATNKNVLKSLGSISSINNLRQMINVLDNASNEMCKIADSADCLRRLHPKRDWKRAAVQSFSRINSLMHELNLNSELYQV